MGRYCWYDSDEKMDFLRGNTIASPLPSGSFPDYRSSPVLALVFMTNGAPYSLSYYALDTPGWQPLAGTSHTIGWISFGFRISISVPWWLKFKTLLYQNIFTFPREIHMMPTMPLAVNLTEPYVRDRPWVEAVSSVLSYRTSLSLWFNGQLVESTLNVICWLWFVSHRRTTALTTPSDHRCGFGDLFIQAFTKKWEYDGNLKNTWGSCSFDGPAEKFTTTASSFWRRRWKSHTKALEFAISNPDSKWSGRALELWPSPQFRKEFPIPWI
jgi:hypothetical protein